LTIVWFLMSSFFIFGEDKHTSH